MNMIRINLVDCTTGLKQVNFFVVPVTDDHDFACIPDGLLSLRTVMRLSKRLKAGRKFGELGKYLWYRLIETPTGKRKPTVPMGEEG
jgi:hypothetical protein